MPLSSFEDSVKCCFAMLDKAANQQNQVMPWMSDISSPKQYQDLITTMEVLIENYDAHKPEIELMFPGIERYEEAEAEAEAEQFSEFNQAIEKLEPSIAMVRVITDQHQLTLSDFQEEIGAKSTVSMILDGKRS